MSEEITAYTDDPQAIFDFVVTKLGEQGGKSSLSRDGATTCAYRGVNDRRCALGWLIPDEQYDPSMESRILNVGTGRIGGSSFEVPYPVRGLVRALQMAHDREPSGDGWTHLTIDDFRRVAERYDLDDSALGRLRSGTEARDHVSHNVFDGVKPLSPERVDALKTAHLRSN